MKNYVYQYHLQIKMQMHSGKHWNQLCTKFNIRLYIYVSMCDAGLRIVSNNQTQTYTRPVLSVSNHNLPIFKDFSHLISS